ITSPVAPAVPSERPAPGPPKVLSRNFQKISPRVQKNQRHPHCPRNTHPRNSSRREKSQRFHWHTTPVGKKPAPPGLFDMNRPRALTIISGRLIKRRLPSPPSSPLGEEDTGRGCIGTQGGEPCAKRQVRE